MTEAYQSFSHAVSLSPKNMAAKVQLANLSLTGYARDPRHPAVLYKQAQSIADELLGPGGDRVEGLRIKGALALIDNQPSARCKRCGKRRGSRRITRKWAAVWRKRYCATISRKKRRKRRATRVDRHPHYDAGYEVLYAMYGSQQNWEKAEALLKLWVANNPKESTPGAPLGGLLLCPQAARRRREDAEFPARPAGSVSRKRTCWPGIFTP